MVHDTPEDQERCADPWTKVSALQMRAMHEPDVVEYLDYRAFLRRWFAARAGRPSVRGFALRAGCSASLVSSTIAGKRHLNTGRAEVWARAMKLSATQTSHFITLVVLAHDPSRERRQRAMTEAVTRQHFHRAVLGDHVHAQSAGNPTRDAGGAEGMEGVHHEPHPFWSSTMAVPSDAVPELEERIARFLEEITHWVAVTEGERDRMYRLTLELSPGGETRAALEGGVAKRTR